MRTALNRPCLLLPVLVLFAACHPSQRATKHSVTEEIESQVRAGEGLIVVGQTPDASWDQLFIFGPYTPKIAVCETLQIDEKHCSASTIPDYVDEGQFLFELTKDGVISGTEHFPRTIGYFDGYCRGHAIPRTNAKFFARRRTQQSTDVIFSCEPWHPDIPANKAEFPRSPALTDLRLSKRSFTVIRNLREFPEPLKTFYAITPSGRSPFMSNPGESFNATDEIVDENAPSARLIMAAGDSKNDLWLVEFEFGGRVSGILVQVLSVRGTKVVPVGACRLPRREEDATLLTKSLPKYCAQDRLE